MNAEESTRPFVSLNMAMSIDGKITTVERSMLRFGSGEDRALMEELRAQSDAVMIGRGTLVCDDPPLVIYDELLKERRRKSKATTHPINIAIASSLPGDADRFEFFTTPDTEKIVFTTIMTLQHHRISAMPGVRVLLVNSGDDNRTDLKDLLSVARSLGIRSLLLEGGGELNFGMIRAGFIDELYITICPFIFGGRNTPTLFDGQGFLKEEICRLHLTQCRTSANGELFLKYSRDLTRVVITRSQLFRNGFELNTELTDPN